MTILNGTRRATFAVIVADQWWYGIDPRGQRTQGLLRKLVVHPTLPLAMGSAGIGLLPAGGRPTTTHLEEIVGEVERPADLTMAGLMIRVEERLHAPVREVLASPLLPLLGPSKNEVAVLIATATRRRAELGRLVLAVRTLREFAPGSIDAPASLQASYSTKPYATGDELFGARYADAAGVVRHLRQAVAGGITAEKDLHGGQNQEVGGPVDIAMVDASGAR